jgi:hypothetical protein
MSDSPTRQEVKEMIEEAVEAKVETGVRNALDSWMASYGLGPHHWVFLDAEYNKVLSRRGMVTKVVITSLVAAICAVTLWSAEEWVKQIVIEHYSPETK